LFNSFGEAVDLAMFTEIDRLKTQLDSLRPLPEALLDNLRELYTVRLTYHSTAIEGNTLTQLETQIVLEKGITIGGKALKDHLEVINHSHAIDYIRDLAQSNDPIGEWEIRQLHGLVCRGETGAGMYRSVNVMAAGSEHRYPDALVVPNLMAEFVTWLMKEPPLHPITLASEVHYRFVNIHPFSDGNGRSARLLMNLILLRSGYPIAVIKTQDRSAYIDAIVSWRSGDSFPLTEMIANTVESALIEILGLV
jgi:Fic family protein